MVAHPLSESQWNRSHFSKSWSFPAEGFKFPLTAPCWVPLALDCDEEMEPLLGMYGSVDAEFERQRTISRTRSSRLSCVCKKSDWPVRVRVDNKGNLDGLRRGESMCIKP